MTKINVNATNSKMVNGKLFITPLKAHQITNPTLKEQIDFQSSIDYPNLGKLVEFKGNYSRSIK
jgi:hypothetical protein